MMNQSRQSRRGGCTGGYAGIMGYGLAYCDEAGAPCGREACARAMSTSWGVSPLDSKKLIRCEMGESCTLGSARNDTAFWIISGRGIAGTAACPGASGALGSAMLRGCEAGGRARDAVSPAVQKFSPPTTTAVCVPGADNHKDYTFIHTV